MRVVVMGVVVLTAGVWAEDIPKHIAEANSHWPTTEYVAAAEL